MTAPLPGPAPAGGEDNPEEYQQLQDVYLKWHNGHRPLSGFIRDLQALIAASNQHAVQKALAEKRKKLELRFVEFDPDVVKLISENLHDLF